MAEITGTALRYDGLPVDYVSIFNWATGACIAQVIPNAEGVWTYGYYNDLNVGITYVAEGCEPITHGAYNFVYTSIASELTGYLMVSVANSGTKEGVWFNESIYDSENTGSPTWQANFSETINVGFFKYGYGANSVSVPLTTTVVDLFSIDWNIELRGFNAAETADSHLLTMELMDANDNVVFALKSERAGLYFSHLFYGSSLSTLQRTASKGGYPSTHGILSFGASTVYFNNILADQANLSFQMTADIASVVKIRFSSSAKSTLTTGGFSGSWMKLIDP